MKGFQAWEYRQEHGGITTGIKYSVARTSLDIGKIHAAESAPDTNIKSCGVSVCAMQHIRR